jgi:hypothetical protein
MMDSARLMCCNAYVVSEHASCMADVVAYLRLFGGTNWRSAFMPLCFVV